MQNEQHKSSPKGTSNNVKVFVRIRPFNEREVNEDRRGIIACDFAENVIVLRRPPLSDKSNKDFDKCFKFDYVFPQDTIQLEVYRIVAAPLVEQVFDGYNATIFAYGQTGTGKTFTMTGGPQVPGIIPNTFTHIFTRIANSTEERSFIVKITYMEIYNEEVRDLLGADSNKKLPIKERKDIGIYVKDLSGFTVDSIESITELMNRGNKNRITRSTMMNNVSSRSHAIFTIAIEAKNRDTNQTTVGKLNLVDLAGSERIKKTGVTGEGLREAGNINQSLSTLSNVIQALVEGKTFVPYRNSKLTRLLQDSLGGNSKTSMIAMVSPVEQDYEETHSTLRYAHKAKYIKNYARINVEESGLIERFEQEIAELQQKLSTLVAIGERPRTSKKKSRPDSEMEEKIKRAENEMVQIEQEKQELQSRIAVIQKKIICGGENLLEKAEQQEFLLLNSGQEIENLDRNRQKLEERYHKMTEEKIDIEEKYSSLQEEDAALNRKIKLIQQRIKEAKDEYADKEHEYQREMEALNDTNRVLVREMQLSNLTIDSYIPTEYKKAIQQYCIFNQDTQEYQLRGVAYTGNNMRSKRQISQKDDDVENGYVKFQMKQPYHKYPEKRRIPTATSNIKRSMLLKKTNYSSVVPKQVVST